MRRAIDGAARRATAKRGDVLSWSSSPIPSSFCGCASFPTVPETTTMATNRTASPTTSSSSSSSSLGGYYPDPGCGRRAYATKGRGQTQPKGFTPAAAMAAKASSNNVKFNPFQSSSNQIAEPYRGKRKMPNSMTKIPRYLYDVGLNKAKDIYCTSKVTSAIKGFDLNEFKRDMTILYEEISKAIANNNLSSCRRDVSDKVMQELKQEQKKRTKNGWARIRWDLSKKGVENVSVVQGRLVATSQDMSNPFAQFTVRFESTQEFGAYDENDRLVAGDSEEVGANLKVVDHWVFERGLGPAQKTNSRWRLCARLIVEE